MKASQPAIDASGKAISRDITIHCGDFNECVDDILNAGTISEKEATFCLLDQRTFQCNWATVEKLARYKKVGMKIELFYFLANGWFERSLSGQKDLDRLAQWWGRDGLKTAKMDKYKRADVVAERFTTEFGYEHVMPWPIFKKQSGGTVMYFMIHATDHPQAPDLMSRAYRNTVKPPETDAQIQMFIEPKGPETQPPAPMDAKLTA